MVPKERYDFSSDHEAQAFILQAGYVPFEDESESIIASEKSSIPVKVINLSGVPLTIKDIVEMKKPTPLAPVIYGNPWEINRRRQRGEQLAELKVGD